MNTEPNTAGTLLSPPPCSASSVHFSSASDDWPTPQDFFDRMNALHGPLELDVCAAPENAKCPRYYTREDDGLAQPWTGRCWMNPPYGRTIGLWMRKAYEESQRGALVVCLVPARTDTAWWHDYAMKGQVTFIRGRLKFGGHRNSAPFPSATIVFLPNAEFSQPVKEPRNSKKPMNKLETTDTAGQAPELGSRALFALVSRVIAHLDRADYPRDGICHHHGLSYTCENDNVGVADYEGKLLVMVYRGSTKYERDANGDYVWPGYTSTEHEGKADAVAKAVRATISKTWNGKEGNDGVSIVLDRPCPEGLLVGIRNYRRMRDVFHPTPSEVDAFQRFSAWANDSSAPTT